jgi:hypothetical protein
MYLKLPTTIEEKDITSDTSYSSSEKSDYSPESESSGSDLEEDGNEEQVTRNYPRRLRTQRQLPGTIPWSAIRI